MPEEMLDQKIIIFRDGDTKLPRGLFFGLDQKTGNCTEHLRLELMSAIEAICPTK